MNPIKCNKCDHQEYVNNIFFKTIKMVNTRCTNRNNDLQMAL